MQEDDLDIPARLSVSGSRRVTIVRVSTVDDTVASGIRVGSRAALAPGALAASAAQPIVSAPSALLIVGASVAEIQMVRTIFPRTWPDSLCSCARRISSSGRVSLISTRTSPDATRSPICLSCSGWL